MNDQQLQLERAFLHHTSSPASSFSRSVFLQAVDTCISQKSLRILFLFNIFRFHVDEVFFAGKWWTFLLFATFVLESTLSY